MEKVYKASVLYDFKAKEAVQLTVYRNDIVTIQDATPSGWCLARHKGKLGWIPKTYVRRMGGQVSSADGAGSAGGWALI